MKTYTNIWISGKWTCNFKNYISINKNIGQFGCKCQILPSGEMLSVIGSGAAVPTLVAVANTNGWRLKILRSEMELKLPSSSMSSTCVMLYILSANPWNITVAKLLPSLEAVFIKHSMAESVRHTVTRQPWLMEWARKAQTTRTRPLPGSSTDTLWTS